MKLTQNVRAVQVPDANPMHPRFTTIYLIGGEQALTIDSGEDLERYRWMLKGYLAALEKTEIAQSAVTHHHADHSANLRWLRDEFGAEAHVFEASRPLLGARLPDTGVHTVRDGDVIEASAHARLTVLHTPGHSPDSVCFYLEDDGVVFTGDTVLGGATTTVSDLDAYLNSLRRLRDLPNLQMVCPGHGPVIRDPRAYIDGYLAHREERERQILALLASGEALTSWQVMDALYRGIDPRLRRAADANVRAHLGKLVREGRVIACDGRRRERPESELAREREEEHARLEVIRRADELRELARRRELARQESPPDDEWEEPPRYQLV